MATEIVVVRHGATEWSANGRHTSRTDLPLTDVGRAEAEHLRERLAGRTFALVLASPMRRARDTAEICGLGEQVEVEELLREWDYGDYEGVTTVEIRTTMPGWTVWSGPCPNGETIQEVGARADRLLARVVDVDGDVAVFSHGHFSRVLMARWLGLPPVDCSRCAPRRSTSSVTSASNRCSRC